MKADGNETPLHGAVLVGYQPVVEVLLNMFAEPNAQNNEGKTALHFACMRGNFSITRLLASRPDVALNVQDSKGNSPFMIACNLLQEQILLFFLALERPISYSIRNSEGKTALEILERKATQAGQAPKFA